MSASARALLGGEIQIPPPQMQNRNENKQFRPERQERQHREKTPQNDPLHTVFFYNINFQISNEEFREFVSQFGEIMNFHPVIDKKGHAFVTFYDIRDAEKAVKEVQDKEFNGRKMNSNFAFRPPNLGKDQMPTSGDVLVSAVDGSPLAESEVGEVLKNFGEIRSITSMPPNVMVRFFNIRAAKNATIESRNYKTNTGKVLDMKLYTPDNNNAPKPNNARPPYPPHYQQYGAPPPYPQYGAPYGMPPPQYGMPPPQPGNPYGMPPPQYGMPPPQYGMPPPQYGMPPPQYGMPPPQQQQQQPPKAEAPKTEKDSLGYLSKLVSKRL